MLQAKEKKTMEEKYKTSRNLEEDVRINMFKYFCDCNKEVQETLQKIYLRICKFYTKQKVSIVVYILCKKSCQRIIRAKLLLQDYGRCRESD